MEIEDLILHWKLKRRVLQFQAEKTYPDSPVPNKIAISMDYALADCIRDLEAVRAGTFDESQLLQRFLISEAFEE